MDVAAGLQACYVEAQAQPDETDRSNLAESAHSHKSHHRPYEERFIARGPKHVAAGSSDLLLRGAGAARKAHNQQAIGPPHSHIASLPLITKPQEWPVFRSLGLQSED